MIIVALLFFILIAGLVALLNGWLLWLGWNYAVVEMFDGASHLDYWSAVLIMFVLNILFGGTNRANRD